MESALPYCGATRVLLAAPVVFRGGFAAAGRNAEIKKTAATERLITMRRIGSSENSEFENAAYYRESGRDASFPAGARLPHSKAKNPRLHRQENGSAFDEVDSF